MWTSTASQRPAPLPHPHGAALRRQRGGTLLGFLAGLVAGLGVAVVVAIFITHAPVPFVSKAGKGNEKVIEPKAGAPLPDPNQNTAAKNKPPAADKAGEKAAEKAGEKAADSAKPAEGQGSVLGGVFSNGQQAGQSTPATPAAPATPATAPAATAPATPAAGAGTATATTPAAGAESPEDKTTYIIQAGAFRVQEDAEAMKAKLALAGYEARILAAEVNGQALFRVRLAPYKALEDVNKAKAKLAENGIESTVIRMK